MKKMSICILFLLFLIILVGCARSYMPEAPGGIARRISEFDGATELYMIPAWICEKGSFDECTFRIGLFWRSTMPEDDLAIIIETVGPYSIKSGDVLHFNIDGEIVSPASRGTRADMYAPTGYYAGPGLKRFTVDRALIQKLLDAKRVVVRIETDGGYLEGTFSKDRATMARPAFREFMERLSSEIQQ